MNDMTVIYKKCHDVVTGKLSHLEFEDFLKTLVVKHYIKIDDLFLLTYSVNFEGLVENLDDVGSTHYAHSVLIHSEIKYLATKLGINFDDNVYDADTFDIFEESGLMEFIVNENPRQYQQYKELVSRAVDMNAVGMIGQLSDTLGLTTESLVKLSKSKKFEELMKTINNQK